MDQETITIVSGLPRSGTSMVMMMLEAGGFKALTDYIRTPNYDNPKGYYEFERVKNLPDDTEWLEDAKGKVVKILAELMRYLPEDFTYKIIFIERNLEEIIASQRTMLIGRNEDPDKVSKEELMSLFEKYLKVLKNRIRKKSNMHVLYLNYNEILIDPIRSTKKINEFFQGVLDEKKMVSVVDDTLYRNRYG